MNKIADMFSFRSFRTRLVVFLLALLIPVLGWIFYYVNSNNTEYTEETINRYLQLGADVFDFTRDQQAQTLQAITSSLTLDFGFRTAYAARDPATLFDAALNVLERSLGSADMLMIVDLDLNVIIDTETQGFSTMENSWRLLLESADRSDEGRADMVITVAGVPYQLIALPLYLPRQVAWIIGGFALDTDFVNRVKETIVSEVSVIRSGVDAHIEVIASTLDPARQRLLAGQLKTDESAYSSLQRIDFQPEVFTTLLRPLYINDDRSIQVAAVIQRSYDENNENVVQFRRLLIQFYLVVLVVSLLAVLILARSITRPVSRLAHVVQRIEGGDYEERAAIESKDELGVLAQSVNSMAKGLAEKEKVRDLLGKVVSHQIAEQLLSNPVVLGGEERVVTILFSDIRGFTSYCEGLSPGKVLEELNKVLTTISDIVEANDGVVDKYQGDAVMALFGAPVLGDNDGSNAMNAALEIVSALAATETELKACVGVNTGLVVAGNLGSSNRLNYSVIGDTVNLAARLESLTRLYNVSNIVGEASVLVAPDFVYRELDKVRVAGKTASVTIYELIAKRGVLTAEKEQELSAYAIALDAYRSGQWQRAEDLFSQLQQKCHNSPLSQIFLDRIKHFKNDPPADDWNGIFTFSSK